MNLPEDLIDYFDTLISPPGKSAYFIVDVAEEGIWKDLASKPDESLSGVIAIGTPTEAQAQELMRVLLPGAHMVLVAPEEEPTGHTGACRIEEAGFEIRDAILLADQAEGIHYVPKAGRKEREAGCAHLEGKTGAEATDRQEGTAGLNSPRAGAGRTASHVKNHHPCLHPDALVMTEKGFRPISEIRLGDEVYTEEGTFGLVEHVTRHPYTSDHLYEILVRGTNYTTLASDNHPFLIWRPKRKGNAIVGGEVVWLSAEEIRKGDYTMTPILAENPNPSTALGGLSEILGNSSPEDFFFLFGLWVAEGVAQRAGHGANVYPSYTLHEDERDLAGRIRSFSEARGFNVGEYPKEGRAVQVMAFDPQIGEAFVTLGGVGASTKVLHGLVFELPRPLRTAVVEGYLAGDGGRVRTYFQAKTVSPDLASQIWILAGSVGYRPNLFRFEAEPGHIGDREFKETLPTYQLQLYDRDLKHQGGSGRKPSRPTTMEHEGRVYFLNYVQAVEEVPYEGDVVNLSVQGSPTFQTAVGMSHNTVKPVHLMERLMADVPKDQGAILDPFAGSGTTAVAGVQTGHSIIGIEREAEYLEIADARVRHAVKSDMVIRQSGIEIESEGGKPPPPPKVLSFEDAFGFGDDE
jgi:hypothetical protein